MNDYFFNYYKISIKIKVKIMGRLLARGRCAVNLDFKLDSGWDFIFERDSGWAFEQQSLYHFGGLT